MMCSNAGGAKKLYFAVSIGFLKTPGRKRLSFLPAYHAGYLPGATLFLLISGCSSLKSIRLFKRTVARLQ
jgi:hypothetical protein